MELYYFGYSLKMLKYLIDFSKSNYNNIKFKGVITQLGKYSSEFINVCKTNDLPINIINSKKELIDICEEKNIKNVIMYEFGIIVPEKLCKNSKVINFHPGSLSTNRGANPINWSILIPGIGAEICAYKILPQIDCGDIVSSKSEEVTLFDTPHTLKEKLEKNIPLMLEEVYGYLLHPEKTETKVITNGIYRQRVTKEDYTIDLDNDKIEIIIRKINSQRDYSGAILYMHNEEYKIINYEISTNQLVLYTDKGRKFIKKLGGN